MEAPGDPLGGDLGDKWKFNSIPLLAIRFVHRLFICVCVCGFFFVSFRCFLVTFAA